MVKIKVTWYKKNGKYYAEGEFEGGIYPFEYLKQFDEMRAIGIRPGLTSSMTQEFHALLEPEDGVPHMVPIKTSELVAGIEDELKYLKDRQYEEFLRKTRR